VFEGISGFLAQAAPTSPGTQPACGGDAWSLPFLFVILFGIMYVFMILPQRRREKQRQRMLTALRKNDHIITIGGVYGVITSIKDDRITIRVDDNKDVKLIVTPSAVASVISREKEEEEKEEAENR
jgi:preprotein translocase subunit YajC